MSESKHERPRPQMSESARYQIRVRGHVDAAAARRLRGLAIENSVDADGAPVATLRGELPDQAALLGILETLNGYQFPLLAAEFQALAREAGEAQGTWRPVSLDDPAED